jgi:hypothetical protein
MAQESKSKEPDLATPGGGPLVWHRKTERQNDFCLTSNVFLPISEL